MKTPFLLRILYHNLVLTLFFVGNTIFAQQIPQLTQYFFNPIVYNPATIATRNNINFDLAIRNQWLRIEGLPLTQTLCADLPIPLFKGGVGLSITNDILGAERTSTINLAYSYHQSVTRRSTISIGIQAGILQKALYGDQLITPNGTYTNNTINHNDNILSGNNRAALSPNFGMGVYYGSPKLQIGVAAQQLLTPASKINLGSVEVTFKHQLHLIINAAYQIPLNNWILTPTCLFKSDFNQHQLDATLLADWNKKYYIATTFRGYSSETIESAAITLAWQINSQWRIAQSYDINLSPLKTYNSGTLETTLHYQLMPINNTRKGKTIYNSRYL